MCGIVTLVGSPRADQISDMAKSLSHRGPDGIRTWISPDGKVAMGHARLSIIDLDQGWQPMVDPDSGHVICYKGEIYNYRELKRELESEGIHFRTQSDTEVILKAFLKWGEKA